MTSNESDARSGALRAVAACIDTIEATGAAVRDVSVAEGSIFSDETLRVRLAVSLPMLSGLASMDLSLVGEDLTVADDGTPVLEFTVVVPLEGRDRSAPETDATAGAAGERDVVVLDPTGAAQSNDTASPETADADREPYKDPERLTAVYEAHETFPEMRDALDVEVTPQTVRRHMIKHGIHEVSSNPFLDTLRAVRDDATTARRDDRTDETATSTDRSTGSVDG